MSLSSLTHSEGRRLDLSGRLLLLSTVLLALVLRVHALGTQSLWYDEAVTAQVASRGLEELTRWTAGDIQPPLYYYLVAGWIRLAGSSEWALRFLSSCAGVLTVPLLASLARRIFGSSLQGEISAVVAALLATLSPLYVYYSQEARMYAVLTFLGGTAGYCLLRASEEDRQIWRWWSGFVAAAVGMLYTHYFGVFLLLAYTVHFLIVWLPPLAQESTRSLALRKLTLGGVAGITVALLYLPWLPAMMNRYQVDRSYWQGELKLGEAIRHLATSYTAGAPETMFEGEAVRLLPWFGLALLFALAALLVGRRGDRSTGSPFPVLFLLLSLLVPVAAVLILASRTPKFNPRYLMLASPFYLLLLAGGAGVALSGGLGGPRYLRRVATLVGVAIILLPVVVSMVAVHNWYTDPAFTKAQWREAAAFVRSQRTDDEAVVLVSGHAWPAWHYYAPEIPLVRLPEIDILDVGATLGFEDAAGLSRAMAGKQGAWLVGWQEEAVDPVGFIPYFLDHAGQRLPVNRQFWHLDVSHWSLDSTEFPAVPRPDHPDGANYGHQMALLGWDQPAANQITLYWRALNPMLADYRVSLVLEDDSGAEVGRWDGRPAGYDYPTTRWHPGEELFGIYPLPLAAGTHSGELYLTVAVYDDSRPSGLDIMDIADNPAGKRVRLGPLRIP